MDLVQLFLIFGKYQSVDWSPMSKVPWIPKRVLKLNIPDWHKVAAAVLIQRYQSLTETIFDALEDAESLLRNNRRCRRLYYEDWIESGDPGDEYCIEDVRPNIFNINELFCAYPTEQSALDI